MIFLRAILIAFVLVCASAAIAADPKLPVGITCADVRSQVAEHGRFKAIRWARQQGYSWAQIAEARRCLR